MKLAIVLSTVLSISLFAGGNVFERGEHVICTDGQLRLAGVPRMVVDEDFQSDSGFWANFDNYNNKMLLDYSNGLKIRLQEGKGGDTAFGLRSRPISVTQGSSFTLLIMACGNINMSKSRGFVERYNTEVLWIAKDGSIIDKIPFNLNSASDKPMANRIVGIIPQKTASMVVCIGADSPNFNVDSVLDIRKITIETVDDKCRLQPVGSMVSRPFPAPTEGLLSWDADIPEGSSISIQIATADDADGFPGKWSAFCGPDWDAGNAFMKSGVPLPKFKAGQLWMRYKILLKADKKSPLVKGIRIGHVSDGNWVGADSEPPVISQTSPLVTQDTSKPFQFEVHDNTVVNWPTLELNLDGKDVTTEAKRDGHTVSWYGDGKFPHTNEPDFHKFTVKVSDFSGNIAVKELFLLIAKPLAQNNVTLRDDGCVLIDGKPFFPIGLYGVCKREFNENNIYKAFEELSLNGFNTAHTYAIKRNNDYAEFLDAAAKYNVKLFVCASPGTNSKNIGRILNDVVKEYRHPHHLAWYVGDDTSRYIKPNELAEVSRIVKSIDPAHITVQADGVFGPGGSQYTAYVNSTEGFLPEIYPVHKGTPAEEIVPTVIRDMLLTKADIKSKATSPKTVWPIIQYFDGWGWPRFPTYQELRAMSYAAIVHGANGITWYTYGGFNNNHGVTSTPERWNNICRLAKEISSLQSVLVSQEVFDAKCALISGPAKDAMNYPSISLLAKKTSDRTILICVNSTLKTIEAEFKINETADIAKVLFEERTLPVKKQSFTDTFAPYDVHVYELKNSLN